MILITVGTQKIKFDRLYEYIKDLKDDEIIVQTGINKWNNLPSNFKVYDYISYDKMAEYLNKSDILITHGGPSNIISGIRKKKKVIVVPRLKKYKEHINDHQLIFSQYLKKNKYCFVATTKEEFILAYKSKKKMKEFISNNDIFLKSVKKEIDILLEVNDEKNN